MDVLNAVKAAAAARRAAVVLPETDEPRIREAAARLEAEGLARPVFLPEGPPGEDEIAAVLAARPGIEPARARRLLAKPLYRAGAMVAAGRADALVAGATAPTARVIEAASMTIGAAPGRALPSSFFLMVLPDDRALIFADCAVNVAPDAAGLADIALASARSAERLLGGARVAMLSYATGTSGSGASVARVRDAAAQVRAAGVEVTGPVQADAALSPAIAAQKGLEAAGAANVLIFPTLDAGNIGYKLVQQLGGAQAVGPVLQGFARPVCDLSRGATVEEIVASVAVTLALG